MEEIYNKWQLQDLYLGNTESHQFTKSELMDFAKYYHTEQLNLYGFVRSHYIQEMEYQAEENECANMYLDDLNIPRKDESGEDYSTVGRIKYLESADNFNK